jgi:low affinity Fe/Cu permease
MENLKRESFFPCQEHPKTSLSKQNRNINPLVDKIDETLRNKKNKMSDEIKLSKNADEKMAMLNISSSKISHKIEDEIKPLK